MKDHLAEERIHEHVNATGTPLSTEEVVHLALCDECSRLLAAITRLWEAS
jgi:hypothetical protein